ncbi:MAG: cytochrome P450 [Alphaproteobacteria bacterium]|nr:cytochrome P450 [Alphaproteobacteria bacterium]
MNALNVPTALPRTRSWPLIGDLPELRRFGPDYLEAQRSELGDLFMIQAGPLPVVLLHHPEHVEHVLVRNASNYAKQGSFWSAVRSLIGLGLPTIEGEVWRSRRRMMNPHFRRKRIAALGEAMAETIDQELARWRVGGEPFNVGHALSRATMAVIVRTMFGAGIEPEQSEQVAEAMSFSLDHMLQKVVTDTLPTWVPVPGRRAHAEAVARIDEVLSAVIARRKAEGGGGDDLLTMLLEMRDDETGQGLDDQQLRDETMSMFIAGYETTAASVGWAAARLAADPELQRALQQEADAVLGDRRPTAQDAHALPLALRVFHEALRLDAPVYFLPRVAVEDDVIAGHHVPAGTMVSVMIDRVHRHPDFWDEPDRFDPDRFLPERAKGRHPAAWIPFGHGQRQCIGKHFANMEGVFLLSMMAQRFWLEPAGEPLPEPQFAITRRPLGGVSLRLHRR